MSNQFDSIIEQQYQARIEQDAEKIRQLQQQINSLKEQLKEKEELQKVTRAANILQSQHNEWLQKQLNNAGAEINYLQSKLSQTAEQGTEQGWVKVSERPLVTFENNYWTCTKDGDEDFIAAVPYNDKSRPNEKNLWWIRHCRIVDSIGLCVVTDDDTEPSGWQITAVTHWQPLPPAPEQTGWVSVKRIDMNDEGNPMLKGTIIRETKRTQQGTGEELAEYIERFIEKQKDNFSILGELQHMRVLLSKK